MGAIDGGAITIDVIVKESQVYLVNAGENVVNNVLEHDGDSEVGLTEEEGVFGDVLANIPEHSIIRRLRGARAEDLCAGDPHGGDSVVLIPGGCSGEMEDGVRPGAVDGREVGGVGRRKADRVSELTGEDGERA